MAFLDYAGVVKFTSLLKTKIETLLETKQDAIEYGTVQGGTGNNKWAYRKWPNGMIEAWGKASASSAQAGSSWASPIYYYDLSVSFPSGIFSSAPDNITLTNANAQWVALGTNAITASGFNTRLIKPTSGAQAVVFNIYAVKYPTT